MIDNEEIKKIIKVFKEHSTFDFSDYSEKSFNRRIEKLLIDENCSIDKLVNKIANNKSYLNYIKNKITVNTTELFRDAEMWVSLYNPLKKYIDGKQRLNIWHAGVSSGEELYSMKMYLDMIGYKGTSKIVGTDISDRIIEVAKKGVYKNNIIADYIENFNLVKNGISEIEQSSNISNYIKIDSKTNLLEINDVIMCRNVLIYFNLDLQNTIIDKFHDLLNNKGLLILGAHESIMPPLSNKFENNNNIYIKP